MKEINTVRIMPYCTFDGDVLAPSTPNGRDCASMERWKGP